MSSLLDIIINKLKILDYPSKTIQVKRKNPKNGEYYFTNLKIKKSIKIPQKELIQEYFDELSKNNLIYFDKRNDPDFNIELSDRIFLKDYPRNVRRDMMLSKLKKDLSLSDTKIILSDDVLNKIIKQSLMKYNNYKPLDSIKSIKSISD